MGVLGPEPTDEHDPTVANLAYEATISEALDEECERETSPSADEVSRQLPEEYGDGTASTTRYSARQNEETPEGLARWVHLIYHSELEDEHETY